MLDQLRNGDTFLVWSLDRQARSTRDLLDTMETISEAGARFQSLSEPWPTPQLMLVADYDRVCCHQSLNAT